MKKVIRKVVGAVLFVSGLAMFISGCVIVRAAR